MSAENERDLAFLLSKASECDRAARRIEEEDEEDDLLDPDDGRRADLFEFLLGGEEVLGGR